MEKVFIGWGPGGNALFEKTWFKNQTNIVHYWIQPAVTETNALSQYLESAEQFLAGLIASNKSYELIVHSFGAQVLIQWLNSEKNLPFSRIKILASNLDNLKAYENLGAKVNVRLFSSSHPTVETFWAHFQEMLNHPNLMDLYWLEPNGATHLRYQELQKTIPHLDIPTFQRVINDFINCPNRHLKNQFTEIPIEIHLGKQDPLMNAAEEAKAWTERFPDAEIFLHEGGHFLHLEKPELF